MMSSVRSREGALVVALAALAGLRVLLLSAAFPFFSNVDEHRHVDGVLKYARGYLPRPDNAAYEPETARYLGLFGSPEYHLREGAHGAYEIPPPAWQRTSEGMLRALAQGEEFLARRTNLEAMQPPAYYVVAGLWLQLGRALGIEGGHLLYWVRGLAVPLIFALVIVAYRSLREIYPDDAFMRLGVPALLAVFPMDAFYYVTRDVLSPLVAGIGFFLALRLVVRPVAGIGAAVAIAGVLALAFFSKYTNVALLAVCGVCTGLALARRVEARSIRGEGGRLLLMWFLVAASAGAWLLRNRVVFGDLTGTAFKIERMGWGRKAFSEYWDHPIFTPSGLHTFVSELIPLFWRGELAWHRMPLATGFADGFYTVTTVALVALAAWGLRRSQRADLRRLTEGLALLLLAAYVGLLAGLSLLYVFHATSNPSADLPYFAQGRLISGALVPFLVLYVRGIEVASERLPRRAASPAAWTCLALIAAVALGSEAALHAPIFASPYNLFHLPR
jgi:hypothetical protein